MLALTWARAPQIVRRVAYGTLPPRPAPVRCFTSTKAAAATAPPLLSRIEKACGLPSSSTTTPKHTHAVFNWRAFNINLAPGLSVDECKEMLLSVQEIVMGLWTKQLRSRPVADMSELPRRLVCRSALLYWQQARTCGFLYVHIPEQLKLGDLEQLLKAKHSGQIHSITPDGGWVESIPFEDGLSTS